jgi:hypothetical protein
MAAPWVVISAARWDGLRWRDLSAKWLKTDWRQRRSIPHASWGLGGHRRWHARRNLGGHPPSRTKKWGCHDVLKLVVGRLGLSRGEQGRVLGFASSLKKPGAQGWLFKGRNQPTHEGDRLYLISALDSWVTDDIVGISFDSDSVRSSIGSSVVDPGWGWH